MKKLKLCLVGMMMAVGLVTPMVVAEPVGAMACPAGAQRAAADNPADCNVPEDKSGGVMVIIKAIINMLLGITGIISVFVIIIAGISMATSQGDTAKVAKSRNAILYGVIGLVIAILSYAIVNFVLSAVFGS